LYFPKHTHHNNFKRKVTDKNEKYFLGHICIHFCFQRNILKKYQLLLFSFVCRKVKLLLRNFARYVNKTPIVSIM